MNTIAMGSEYSHMALNLAGVILILCVLMYILKKVKTSKSTNNRDIKIINAVSIGTKERVLLLEINNTTLLVGATPNHISTLYVFNESDSIKPMHDAHNDIPSFAKEMAVLKYSE